MGEVITFDSKREPPANIIALEPLAMRWGEWEGGFPMLVLRSESERFERHRVAVYRDGHTHISQVPNHFTLRDGTEVTLWALFRWRHDPGRMRDVYFLAGLMECVTLVPHPVLRTVLIRTFYRRLQDLQEELGVRWRGRAHRFLFPMAPYHRTENDFSQRLQHAQTLQELFGAIEEETHEQFLILGSEYVFYLPRFGPNTRLA